MSRERVKTIVIGLTAGLGLAVLGVTASQGADVPTSGQALVDYRHDQLKKTGGAMEYLGQYDGSDPGKAAAMAKIIDDTSGAIVGWFPQGSGPGGPGIEKTHAKAEIWSNFEDFKTKAKAFDDASDGLTKAVATNDPGQITAAVKNTGGACKACHEKYREKDNDH